MIYDLFREENFRLDAASIAAMAEFTLSFLILVYFLSLRGKTHDTWLMIGFVGLNLLVYLVDIGVTSSKPPLYIYFRISHAILISVLTLYWTWCAYTYRGTPIYREAYFIISVESLVQAGLMIYLFSQGLTNMNFSEILLLYYVLIVFYGWSILVLARRAFNVSRYQEPQPEVNLNNLPNQPARTAQSLGALALLFTFFLSFMILSVQVGSALSYHAGQLLLLLGVLILHLNYANEETTFQVKLISLPLATTLAILGILPFLLYGVKAPELTWNFTNPTVQRQLRVFAWLIPSSTIFILVSFVLFYWVGLLRPLARLLKGVHRIEEGDLEAQLPVLSRDELGYFAFSLNRMAASLKASHEELEKRVAERTAALQASLVRLQSTQAQLIQSEKMASLGELTAGIAHEIQNPLNFVDNFSEVSAELSQDLQNELQAGNAAEVKDIAAAIEQNLQKIRYHGQRADAIVKNMLQHSRSSTGQKEPTDINALAEEYLRLSYHGLRAKDKNFNAVLVTDYDKNLGKIAVIPQDIGRVFLNLLNNAFYAIREKQKLQPDGYQPQVNLITRRLPEKVLIKVKDNGMGIPKEALNKIMQPFFTTKPAGEGTGLGLSLSYDIITKGHGGNLEVETEPGQFSEFSIYLPVS